MRQIDRHVTLAGEHGDCAGLHGFVFERAFIMQRFLIERQVQSIWLAIWLSHAESVAHKPVNAAVVSQSNNNNNSAAAAIATYTISYATSRQRQRRPLASCRLLAQEIRQPAVHCKCALSFARSLDLPVSTQSVCCVALVAVIPIHV